jgi:hypothetical protein
MAVVRRLIPEGRATSGLRKYLGSYSLVDNRKHLAMKENLGEKSSLEGNRGKSQPQDLGNPSGRAEAGDCPEKHEN